MTKRRICSVVAAILIAAVGIGVAVYSFTGNKDEDAVITEQETNSEKATEKSVEKAQTKSDKKNQTEEKTEKKQDVKQEDSVNTQQASSVGEENKTYNPTFMYFVDNEFEDSTKSMIEELKSEFSEVIFDIKNVEKEPSLLENFSLVDGNIPTLIMLDMSNNICDFKFKCTDKEQLKVSINLALGK